MGKETLS